MPRSSQTCETGTVHPCSARILICGYVQHYDSQVQRYRAVLTDQGLIFICNELTLNPENHLKKKKKLNYFFTQICKHWGFQIETIE